MLKWCFFVVAKFDDDHIIYNRTNFNTILTTVLLIHTCHVEHC